MEWLELIELTDEIARLRYYPEKSSAIGEFGEVTYFRKTRKWHFDKIVSEYGTEYAFQACLAAKNCDDNGGHFKEIGLTAWY